MAGLEQFDEQDTFLQELLRDFSSVYPVSAAAPLASDEEYMRLTELRFLLKNIRELVSISLYQSYSRGETTSTTTSVGTSDGGRDTLTHNIVDRGRLSFRIAAIDRIIAEIRGASYQSGQYSMPRIQRLCMAYGFSPRESDLFHLVVIVQGSHDSHVLNALIEEDYLRRISGFQRLCGLSDGDIEALCDPERTHMKEGMLTVDDDNGSHVNIRCPRTAVQILYGRSFTEDDLLKISQTALEDVIAKESEAREGEARDGEASEGAAVRVRKGGRAKGGKAGRGKRRLVESESPPLQPPAKRGSLDLAEVLGKARNSPFAHRASGRQGKLSAKDLLLVADDGEEALLSPEGPRDGADSPESVSVASDLHLLGGGADDKALQPYSEHGQLEYLDDAFQTTAVMVKANAARLKDDMKKEGTRMSTWDVAGEVKHGRRELQAKLRVLESKMARRVELTREAGLALPRLEVISERLHLDAFEKKMIVLLMGVTISPVVKTLMSTLDKSQVIDDNCNVGQVLSILCPDFSSQVESRKYFYRSGKLLSNGIISLSRPRWHQGTGDLTDQRIVLDRRVLDFSVGLDTEINELVEGSDLYEPTVRLSQVVLPEGQIDSILRQCQAYDAFRKYRVDNGLEEKLAYGNGLVVMLCGKSGTGKTMTVNAIAKEMRKKVLLVDFQSLSGRKDGGDTDADLRGLFREAHMNNAILFFDECENVFRSRNQGGDRLLNSLLTEIERHEGIVFLATNRPYELDEAMHRRITAVIEYRAPDYSMRRKIWTRLLGDGSGEGASGSLALHADVDANALAVKFELTGGFIKNAVLSALLTAISRSEERPVLCQRDLVDGCRLQMRGSLSTKGAEGRDATQLRLASLHLPVSVKESMDSILRFERARTCIYGSWMEAEGSVGGGEALQQRGCVCVFAGPTGSGKRTLAGAVALELGRRVKHLHVAELMSGGLADTTAYVSLAVQDARLGDAVVVVDGFEHVIVDEGGVSGEGSLKIHMVLSRLMDCFHLFPGLVVLVCHIDGPQNVSLQRNFAARLYSYVRFANPPYDVRAKLWQHFLPKKAPLASDIAFTELGRKFDLNAGSIRSAVVRACAEAISRAHPGVTEVRHRDLLMAGECEVLKLRDGNFDLVSKLFV